MDNLDKEMEEVRSSFSRFQARRKLQEPAENAKMAVVGILVLSLFFFEAIGRETAKSIIWYWAGFMVFLLVACAIQDYRISQKIKRDGIEL